MQQNMHNSFQIDRMAQTKAKASYCSQVVGIAGAVCVDSLD